jgi:hypothetical protein
MGSPPSGAAAVTAIPDAPPRRCRRKLELIEKFCQARSKTGFNRASCEPGAPHAWSCEQRRLRLLASATHWRNTYASVPGAIGRKLQREVTHDAS